MLTLSLSEIQEAIEQSPMVIEIEIPDDIINAISWYSMEDFELKLDRLLVEFVSGKDWSSAYSLDNLFRDYGVYCTSKPQSEILIKLSTKCHIAQPVDYDFKINEEVAAYQSLVYGNDQLILSQTKEKAKEIKDKGFIITKVGVESVGFGYTSPVQQVILWSFNEKPPKEQEIEDKYGGDMNIKKLKGKLNTEDINSKDEGRCVLIMDTIGRFGSREEDLSVRQQWIKAKYILIKFIGNDRGVDVRRFTLRVIRL